MRPSPFIRKWWQKIRDYDRPLLVYSGAHRPIMVATEFNLFLDLVKENQDLRAENKRLIKELRRLSNEIECYTGA